MLLTPPGLLITIGLAASSLPAFSADFSLDVQDGFSALTLASVSSARVAANRENLRLFHSNYRPAGRFVRKGQKIMVTVQGDQSIVIGIGLFDAHKNFNGGGSAAIQHQTVLPGTPKEVTAIQDGLVYVINHSGKPLHVSVAGGEPIPTLVRDQTSKSAFDAQMARWPKSPFAILVGERVFVDFQYPIVSGNLAKATSQRIADWDNTVNLTNTLYGLSVNGKGDQAKSNNLIHISNPDTGVGSASAVNYHLTFQNSSGAGATLLTREAGRNWALSHEIGHTYQSPQYNWGGMTEVTVNISSVFIQERLTGSNQFDSAELGKALAKFRTTPVGKRNFASASNVFLKTLMFDQLRRAFGEHFYPRLSVLYRQLHRDGLKLPTDAAKQQRFILSASQVADRDLQPFFDAWGLRMDAATRAELSKRPPLKVAIWDNQNRATDVVEYVLPPLP